MIKSSNTFTNKPNPLKYLSIVLIVFLASSCSSKKDIHYFQDRSNINGTVHYEINKIQLNDILNIRVMADDPEAADVFNLMPAAGGGMMMLEGLKMIGYLVGEDGTFSFPKLGIVKATDFTPKEMEEYISKKLIEGGFLNNPTVTVRVVNNKFTVLGEVASPGTYNYAEQVLTLPQALGMVGDLTIMAERKNIMLIRELNGERTYTEIDLTKTDWINSEYYYIRQNDVLYVYPNNPRVKMAGFITNVGGLIGIVSFILTITILVKR